MKEKDVKEYSYFRGCYGETLTVNGVDFEDIPKADALELICDILTNNINSNVAMFETLKNLLEFLQLDQVEEEINRCDTCGDYNEYERYVRND